MMYSGEEKSFGTKEEAIDFFYEMKDLHPDCVIKARTTTYGINYMKEEPYTVFVIPKGDEGLTYLHGSRIKKMRYILWEKTYKRRLPGACLIREAIW